MHFFIDIREYPPYASLRTRYAEEWVKLWKKYHPGATFSYLIFAEQEKKDSSYITVPKPTWPFFRSGVTAPKKEIFRSVNFSVFPPYDSSIPTVSHIFDNADWLYPEIKNMSYFRRKQIERNRKKTLKQSMSVIVPNMYTGNELVELWHVKEEKVEIIPYIPFTESPTHHEILRQFQIREPYFLYDGSYGNESNILGLLRGFGDYVQNHGGTYQLVLHGYAGSELSNITQLLRSLNLTESVRFVGLTTSPGREALYQNARGWISIGPYYRGGPALELTQVYHLPLLLSEIKVFDTYPSLKVHPNHLEELGKRLKELEITSFLPAQKHDEHAYIHAYEKLISRAK